MTEKAQTRSLLHMLVCSCRDDDCPRRAEADRVLADVWDEAIHHVEGSLFKEVKRAAMRDNPYRDFPSDARCTGAGDCPAALHIHGCYADRDGTACDDPEDHRD